MYVASFLTFMTIGGFPSFVEDMKVSFFLFPFLVLHRVLINSTQICDTLLLLRIRFFWNEFFSPI